MDARPILENVARVLHQHGLEAILIGNAAAALQGAPVTTVDIDFLLRATPGNRTKLKAIAKALGATLFRPFYPSSGLLRLQRDDDNLQLDFMPLIHGFRSFEALQAQSEIVELAGHPLHVAKLAAVIKSKEAAARPRDKAVLDILKKTLHEKEAPQSKTTTRRPQGRKRT